MSCRDPQAWPPVPVQASLCCWFPKLLAFDTASLSPLPGAKSQASLAPLQMQPKCLPGFLSLTLSFTHRAGDTGLLQWGNHSFLAPADSGDTGWVWQAGSPGWGCPLPGQAWGEEGGLRALGWPLAGVGRARTARVVRGSRQLSNTYIWESLWAWPCARDCAREHKDKKSWPLPSRNFYPVGSSRTLAPEKQSTRAYVSQGFFSCSNVTSRVKILCASHF